MSADVSAPYWEGAASGRLVLQQCERCGTIRHYPRALCSSCYSFDSSPMDGGSTGMVHSWTVAHHAFSSDLPAELPYTLVTVDIAVGVRVLGLFEGTEEPEIGLSVRLHFEPRGSVGTPIPIFTREAC